jgi:hypothetical protein
MPESAHVAQAGHSTTRAHKQRAATAGQRENVGGATWPTLQPWGSQVLPRDLSLFDDGTLRIAPIPELKSLRIVGQAYSATTVKKSVQCLPFNGTQLEVNFTVTMGQSDGPGAAASVIVMGSPTGSEQTVIGVNRTHLFVDQRKSSLTPDLTHEQEERVRCVTPSISNWKQQRECEYFHVLFSLVANAVIDTNENICVWHFSCFALFHPVAAFLRECVCGTSHALHSSILLLLS